MNLNKINISTTNLTAGENLSENIRKKISLQAVYKLRHKSYCNKPHYLCYITELTTNTQNCLLHYKLWLSELYLDSYLFVRWVYNITDNNLQIIYKCNIRLYNPLAFLRFQSICTDCSPFYKANTFLTWSQVLPSTVDLKLKWLTSV